MACSGLLGFPGNFAQHLMWARRRVVVTKYRDLKPRHGEPTQTNGDYYE